MTDINDAKRIIYREVKQVWEANAPANSPIIFPNTPNKSGNADAYCSCRLGAVVPRRIALNVPDVKNTSHVEINIYTEEGKGEGGADDIVNAFIQRFSGNKIERIRFQDDIMPRHIGADNGFFRTLVMINLYWVDNPKQ